MYKELVKQEKGTVLPVVGIISIILIAATIMDMCTVQYKLFVHLGVLFLAAICVYWFVKNYMLEYIYAVVDNVLIIKQKLGSKETLLLNIELEQIELIYDMGNCCAEEYSRIKISEKFGFPFGKKKYIMVYAENGVNKKVMFEPSDKLIEILREHAHLEVQ